MMFRLCPVVLLIVVLCCRTYAAEGNAPTASLGQAASLRADGKIVEALNLYTRVATESATIHEVKEAQFASAELCSILGNFDGAIKGFTEFASRYPDDARAAKALALAEQCRSQQASEWEVELGLSVIRSRNRSDENGMSFADANYRVGKAKMALGESDTAMPFLDLAIASSSDPNTRQQATELLEECKNRLVARGVPGDIAYQTIAHTELDFGRDLANQVSTQAARPYFARALERASTDVDKAWAHVLLGMCLLTEPAKARAELRAARDMISAGAKLGDEYSEIMAQLSHNEARLLIREGLFAEAIRVCEEDRSAPSSDLDELDVIKATALIHAERYEEAVATYLSIRDNNISTGTNAHMEMCIGDCWRLAKQYSKAAEAYTRAMSLYPTVPNVPCTARAALAECLLLQGDEAGARAKLQEIVRDYPNTACAEEASRKLASGVYETKGVQK